MHRLASSNDARLAVAAASQMDSRSVQPVVAEEVPAARAEEVPAARVEEVPAARVEEVPVAQAVESPLARAEEVLVARVEEVLVARAEEVLVARVEEVPVARVEEVPVARAEEVLVARAEEVPAARVEEVPVARMEEVPVARVEQDLAAVVEARARKLEAARAVPAEAAARPRDLGKETLPVAARQGKRVRTAKAAVVPEPVRVGFKHRKHQRRHREMSACPHQGQRQVPEVAAAAAPLPPWEVQPQEAVEANRINQMQHLFHQVQPDSLRNRPRNKSMRPQELRVAWRVAKQLRVFRQEQHAREKCRQLILRSEVARLV